MLVQQHVLHATFQALNFSAQNAMPLLSWIGRETSVNLTAKVKLYSTGTLLLANHAQVEDSWMISQRHASLALVIALSVNN